MYGRRAAMMEQKYQDHENIKNAKKRVSSHAT